MSARDAILAALDPAPADRARVKREAAALVDAIERPTPGAPLVDALVRALAQPSVGATVERIADMSGVPGAVRGYLNDHAPDSSVYLANPHSFAGLRDALPIVDHVPVDGGVVLAQALFGVAETGSLVIDTGPDLPMLPHFLALHHLVIVRIEDIVAQLEEIPPPAAIPRARFWITGVSGTTDIEGQYVRGAHGPRFLHVMLVG